MELCNRRTGEFFDLQEIMIVLQQLTLIFNNITMKVVLFGSDKCHLFR